MLARSSGLALSHTVAEKLGQLMDHLMWITRPDGTSPLVGDDDGGELLTLGTREPCDFRGTLATGSALFGRPDWKHVAGNAGAETLWLLGPESLQNTGGWSYVRLDPFGNEVATETIPVPAGYDLTVPSAILFQPSSKPILVKNVHFEAGRAYTIVLTGWKTKPVEVITFDDTETGGVAGLSLQ